MQTFVYTHFFISSRFSMGPLNSGLLESMAAIVKTGSRARKMQARTSIFAKRRSTGSADIYRRGGRISSETRGSGLGPDGTYMSA